MRLELRICAQERVAVFQQQPDENFAHDASSYRAQMKGSLVFLELLLRFGKYVVPKRRIFGKARRDVRDLFVIWSVSLVRLTHFQLAVFDRI